MTPASGIGKGTSFSPDGTYLAVAVASSPYIQVYKRAGDTFTQLPALTAAASASRRPGTSFARYG